MGKIIKLIVAVAIIAVAAYALLELRSGSDEHVQGRPDGPDDGVRVEEKYGFTTETVGD